ncbi:MULTISPECIES: hypothetical protein [unclassified Croceitalea]|uniref:hypothetical protein n=1 Tax=unclassified Croceitalea TaxID=2632280 RepID=UPI0030DDBE1A
MKNYIYLPIIVLTSWVSFSQDPPSFVFKKNNIKCIDSAFDESEFLVFNGEITLQEAKSSAPIIGQLYRDGEIHYFEPIVPFAYEKKYSLAYKDSIVYFKIETPKDYQFLSVNAIYPRATELPANILKFHVQFSRPINLANVYDHIYFISSRGIIVDRAILPLENVLISADGTLLTLWIEPGRQKRGLSPNEELGQVFSPGESYTLVVSNRLKDQNGINMQNPFSHQFRVMKPDREKPKIASWEITAPLANTTSDLVINTGKALDFMSATQKVTVYDSQENLVYGQWDLTNGDQQLIFKPNKKWVKGTFSLLFDERLDDLAGNNLLQVFDNEISTKSEQANYEEFKLSFVVK